MCSSQSWQTVPVRVETYLRAVNCFTLLHALHPTRALTHHPAVDAITREDVDDAQKLLSGHIRRT
jgi:DNA-binding GntR family transcriptional regulator